MTESTVRVLIAEDNADHLLLAEMALRALPSVKVDTIGAHDGQEALAILNGEGTHATTPLPDLVLLDLSMPRVDGLTVLREMRKNPSLASLPVVVLTSSSRPEDIDAAYAYGANSYVVKSSGLSNLAQYWLNWSMLPSRPRRGEDADE